MKFSALISLVRTLVPKLLICCTLGACTVRHTAEVSRQVVADLGLASTVEVRRSGAWAAPDQAVVFLAEPLLSRELQRGLPRLHTELNKVLEAEVQEQFRTYHRATGKEAVPLKAAALLGCNLLLQIQVRQVDENLSSGSEWLDDSGVADADTGRDRLHLILKIYDVGTGDLLDILSAQSKSGAWRWSEHRALELVQPAVQALLQQIRGPALVRER